MSKVWMGGRADKTCLYGWHDYRLLLVERGPSRVCLTGRANGFAYACSICGERPK